MIAIIPAGGKATRINGIPKYLLPTANGALLEVLIERLHNCHPRQIVIMAKGINTTLLSHAVLADVLLANRDDQSMSHAVMLSRDYALTDENALFGMPDTYFDDDQAFVKLAAALDSGADVAVGIFQARRDQRNGGMCRVDGDYVTEVVDKPEHTTLRWIWGVLAWRPAFWQHMDAADPHVGYALPRAIQAGLDVRAVKLDGEYYDCGTFAGYYECLQHIMARNHTVEVASWLA